MSLVQDDLLNLAGLMGVGKRSENLHVNMFSFMVGVGLNLDPEDGASNDLTGDVHDFEVVQLATGFLLDRLLEGHNHVNFFLLSSPWC
jgi:hypothetical protein